MQNPLRRSWTDPGRDPELTDAAQRGDLAALFTLLRRYRAELWRVCLALTLDRERAEQLFHDTLLRASHNLRSVPRGTSFLPWLVRIAAHLAAASSRGGPRRRGTVAADLARALGIPLGASESAVLERFADMNEADRLLLALASTERLPYRELAAVTRGESISVMHQVARLRARLADGEAA